MKVIQYNDALHKLCDKYISKDTQVTFIKFQKIQKKISEVNWMHRKKMLGLI